MNQENAMLLEMFEMDDAYERHLGCPTGAFKRRHFKKALKKIDAGLPLMPGELYCFQADELPEYDMDGSPFGTSEFFSEYAEPECTAADWRR